MNDPLGDDILREYRESAGIPDRTTTEETSLAQGLRSGVFGAGSQLQAVAGGVGEALGFDEFAQDRYAASRDLSEQAQRYAPPVTSSDQVDGVGSALRYAAGLTGQMLPVMVPQVAAGLFPGGALARLAATTGVAAPFEIGDVIQRQQQDPVSLRESAADRLGAAALTGGASAIAQGVVPAIVGGQLAGATAREALRRPLSEIGARAVGNTALESATEAGGEVVKQAGMRLTNEDAKFDLDQIRENAIAGAVAGAPLAGVGAVGEFAQGRVRRAVDAVQALPGKAKEAVSRMRGNTDPAADQGKPAGPDGPDAPDSPGGVLSRLRDLYDEGKAAATRAATRMARGDEFAEPERFAGAQGDRLKQAVAEDDATSVQRAQQWVQDLSQKALSPEKRAALQQAAADLSSRANRATVAALKRGQDMAAEAAVAAARLADRLRGAARAARGKDDSVVDVQAAEVREPQKSRLLGKRSEDYSGVRAKILEAVVPAIRQHNPDLLDNSKALQDVAENLRAFLQLAAVKRTNELDQGAIDDLALALGPNVVQVMGQVHEAVGGLDAAQSERLYDSLNKLGRVQKSRQSLFDTMMQSLRPELQDSVTTSGIRKEAETLRSWVAAQARGALPSKSQKALVRESDRTVSARDRFLSQQIKEQVALRYGDKADAVLAAAEAETKQERAVFDLNEDALDANPELDADEQALDAGDRSLREGSAGEATDRLVTTAKDGRLYRRPETDEGIDGAPPAAVSALEAARKANPGYEVRFETADKLDINDEVVQRHITRRAKDLIAESDGELSAEDARAQAIAGLKDFGVVVAEATRQETALNSRELESIRLDAKKHSKSPSRIQIGEGDDKKLFDAVKLTALMNKRASRPEDYTESDNKSALHRDARMFLDGLAALQDRFGPFDVPDTLVFTLGGATVADIKKLSFSTESRDGRFEQSTENELELELKTLRQRYRREAERGAPEKDLAKLKERGDKLKAKLADARLQALRDADDLITGKRGTDPRGPTVETLSRVQDDEGALRVDEAGQPLDKPRDKVAPLQRMADEMRASTVAAQRALGEKLAQLVKRTDLSKNDAQKLQSIAGIVKPSDRAGPINALAKKYGVQASADARLEAQVEAVLRNVKPKKSADTTALDTMLLDEEYGALDTRAKVDKFLADAKARYAALRRKSNESDQDLTKKEATLYGRLLGMFGPKATADLDAFYDGVDDAAPEVAAKGPKEQLLQRARSADSSFLERVARSTDAKGLQRAAAELAKAGGADKALAAINERLGELVQNPDVAYGLLTRKYSLQAASGDDAESFSLQGVTPGANGPVNRKEVLDYINRVLGNSVRVQWANLNYAGSFTREGGTNNTPIEDVIRLSVHALNPKSVAYHEALHAFFQKLADTKNSRAAAVLMKAASTPAMQRRLRELLKGETDALAQLTDPEERAAYMYQFWAAGETLPLNDTATTWLGKVAELIRSVLGIWSNDERALHIMDYFHSGQYAQNMGSPDAVARALMEPGTNKALERAKSMTQPLARLSDVMLSTGGERLRDTDIPALVELADAMKRKLTKEGRDAGYVPAARTERTRVMNDFAAAMAGYSAAEIAEATEAMQRGVKATGKARQVQTIVQGTDGRGGMLGKMFDYMRAAGVDIKKLGGDKPEAYFPRVWDASYISTHENEFLAMLQKYKDRGEFTGSAKKLLADLITSEGAEFTVEVDRPGMQFGKKRKLDFIEGPDAAPFLRKNLFEIMNSYVTQATRRGEWARRFGDDGKVIGELLDQARNEGATPEQINDAKKFIRAVDGTLGDTLDPNTRRLFGNVMVYQNIRLLPLAIFSSIVDPVGVVVRGGTVGDAFGTFKRGIKETVKNFQKNPTLDAQTELAQMLGIIDNAALTYTIGALYSQGMVGDTGRKINDTFFRYNLLEQFNRSMRVGATQAAIGFIKRHANGADPQHSERFLRELGLEASDVKLDANGFMLLTEADGLTTEQAAKLRMAINRWVDGAVLRPDAVDKPVWMSDPHYALIAHLKQFVFAFQETILKRVVHEYRNGNYRPAMALASYVPFMIASDVTKGLLQTGGEEPAWKREWGVTDYVWSGVQRGGLLGVGQFGADALGDIERGGVGAGALVGPTIEQLTDAVATVGGAKQFDAFLLKSMPANAVYAEAFRGEPTEARTE